MLICGKWECDGGEELLHSLILHSHPDRLSLLAPRALSTIEFHLFLIWCAHRPELYDFPMFADGKHCRSGKKMYEEKLFENE